MKRFLILLFILTLTLNTFSCSSGSSGSEAEKTEVLEAVKKYNGMLIRTYLEANPGLLAGVATEKQIRKIIPTTLALQAANSLMMSEQKTFLAKKVTVKRAEASVETEEEWVYWWQDKDTGQITKPEQTIVYKIRYHFIKHDSVWLVDSLEDAE